jgi:hypothetical protein
MQSEPNPQLTLAHNYIQYTNRNVFLTGKAGTGKTTFLRNLQTSSPKRMIVVAPTGVAAINAGGVTVHSMFQLPFGPILPDTTRASSPQFRFSQEKINIIKSMDLLVIDEISMVRADLLDGIDGVLKQYRRKDKPFGGVQLLMIGDLQQLAPVIRDDEWQLLKPYYDTPFFFSSRALQQTTTVNIELKHIYRQSDSTFIELLNKVRQNQMDDATIAQLNQRCIPGFADTAEEGYIILTTHNNQARSINLRKMDALHARSHVFTANVSGDFPPLSYPTDEALTLKAGAQVMFVKNDPSPNKLYYNGKIGKIEKIMDDAVYVRCPNETSLIEVLPQTWQNMKYVIDEQTKEITETEIGKFEQLPLKTAWAITIHKSQGLTFEKAVIDAGSSFAHGQVYVALSRCKTLEGMVLNTPITPRSLHNDTNVLGFTKKVEENPPSAEDFEQSKHQYQHSLLAEMFDLGVMKARLSYLYRQTGEHASALHGSLVADIKTMQQQLNAELVGVADKFNKQMAQLLETECDIEKNVALQERIAKAAVWFADKTEALLALPLQKTAVVTDNKAVKKTVADAFNRLKEETTTKLACFRSAINGFSVNAYLSARAKAALDKPLVKAEKTPKTTDTEIASLSVEHVELYKQLKQWRTQKAQENNWPAYVVMSTETLVLLANQLPVTAKELGAIKGFGKKKLELYGAEIVEMISAYRQQNGISEGVFHPISSIEATPKTKKEKIDSKQVSFDLLQSGKSIDEIAAERGLTNSTIEGHLAHFIKSGQLSLGMVLPNHKVQAILAYYATHQPESITDAKLALGDDVSYGEIRLVLASMQK